MKQKIQANIQGYKGRPASLFGLHDTETGVLVIAKLSTKRMDPQPGCAFITNQLRTEHDFYIDETKLLDSISSYYRLKNGLAENNETALLRIDPKAGNADPSSGIEMDGVSGRGMEYRISPDVTNAQIALLAMCLYVEGSSTINDTLEMFDELEELMEGNWLTI